MKAIPSCIAALYLAVAALANAQDLKIVNAASGRDGLVAPGSIISILGKGNLTNSTASAPGGSTLPQSLGGVTVTVGGLPAGLFYVSPTQVNARIDTHANPGPADVILTSPAGVFSGKTTISASAPGIFATNGTGSGEGAIIDAVTYELTAFSGAKDNNTPTYLAIYATGLDLSEKPTVRIGGVAVPVLFYGEVQPPGLQQINVQLPDAVSGAGRVEVTVESKGQKSNVVEVVILAKPGQGSFPSSPANQARSRELSSVAYVPNSSLVLVADENDDVLRVVDVKEKQVLRTIALAAGAQPVALAVNGAGTLALAAERNRDKVAVVDLSKTPNTVTEVSVGRAPVNVAISANGVAIVPNQTDNTVSIFSLASPATVTAVPVGTAPRGVAADALGQRAYVTNQGSGTISVIDIGAKAVVDTIDLGASARPQAIQVVAVTGSAGYAVVTDPSAGPEGRVAVIDLATKKITSLDVNPERSGGASAIAVSGNNVYFANQTGGSVTAATLTSSSTGVQLVAAIVKVDLGARALAFDTKDNLLVVANEGSGTLTLVDAATRQVVGRVTAIRSNGEEEAEDDHDDRDRAVNIPTVTAINPVSGKAGATVASFTVTGTNLQGATALHFVDPASIPGKGNGRGNGNGNSGLQDHGPFASFDDKITATNVTVNAAGTQITASVQIAAGHAAGTRVVRVVTPNGESTYIGSKANTFEVTQ